MTSIWIWIAKLCKIIKSKYRIKDGLDKKDQQQNFLQLYYLAFIKLILKVLAQLQLRQDFKKTYIEKLKLKIKQTLIRINQLKI